MGGVWFLFVFIVVFVFPKEHVRKLILIHCVHRIFETC